MSSYLIDYLIYNWLVPNNIIKQFLINLPRPIKKGLVFFLDLLICGLSVWLTYGLRLDQWGDLEGKQWMLLWAAIGFSFPLFIYFGLYRAIFSYVGSAAFLSITHVFVVYTGIIFCIFSLIGVDKLPWSIGIIQPLLLFIGISVSRYFIRYWLGEVKKDQKLFQRGRCIALIYGAGPAGRQLASALFNSKEIFVKGFIDDSPRMHGGTVEGIPVHPNVGLLDLIRQLGITDVFLAIPSSSHTRRAEIIDLLNGCGVRVRTLSGLIDLVSGTVKASDLRDLDMNDLLGRAVVPPELKLLEKNIRNRVVLVTGAGGSIGSELCHQIINFGPKSLILIDNSEHSLYVIYERLKNSLNELKDVGLIGVSNDQAALFHTDVPVKLVPCLASVRDKDLLLKIFRAHEPFSVFHAAAYKHVPLVEENPAEGIRNNVFGTLICAQVSLECGVSQFTLVSTDKAVRPTNVMGASKRIAELVLQGMAGIAAKTECSINFSMVRFGNVLGSSGSVAPLFSAQIAAGGPITLTHPEVTRFFMTIPEAAQLVIQAGAMAVGGDVFVLDMGEPVRIYDLAVKMIYLSGLLVKDDAHPHGDIEIKVTGLRPGEKLYEELLIGANPQPTLHPKIMKAHENFLPWSDLQLELEKLNSALDTSDDRLIKGLLKNLVPGYEPSGDNFDWSEASINERLI